jgi:hypothetical protein
VFQSIFGNIDEFINNVKTKHIKLGIPSSFGDDTATGAIYIDVTSSISAKISPTTEEEVIEGIIITGSFPNITDFTISVLMDIMCNSTDMMGSWTAKKEPTPTEVKTELEAKLEEKINNILVDFGLLDIREVYRTILRWERTHVGSGLLNIRFRTDLSPNSTENETFVGTAQWVYGEGMNGAYHLIGSLSGSSYEGSKLVEILVDESGILECKNVSTSIIYNWDSFDLSVSEGTVSQEVYDNLLKADVVIK